MRQLFLSLSFASLLSANPNPVSNPIGCSEPGKLIYPYRAFNNPTATADHPLPLVIFLHGLGERGTNNTSQVGGHISGLIEKTQGDGTTAAEHPAILVAPQASNGWFQGNSLQQLVIKLLEKYHADPDRVYLTGLSAGGQGTWLGLGNSPELFAAGVPLSAVKYDPARAQIAAAHMPVWTFHGLSDGTVGAAQTTGMVDAIIAAGGLTPRYTKRPGWGHSDWNNIYSEKPGWTNSYEGSDPADTTERLYSWLFSQKKEAARAILPGESLLIDFGARWLLTGRQEDTTLRWNNALLKIASDPDSEIPALPRNMVTSTGVRTRVALTQSIPFGGDGARALTDSTLYPEQVQRDGWHSGGFSGGHAGSLANTSEITITGLTPTAVYQVKCFGSHSSTNASLTFLTRYQIGSEWHDIDTRDNTSQQAEFASVSANSMGELKLKVGVSPDGTSLFSYLNALELTALTPAQNSLAYWINSEIPNSPNAILSGDQDNDVIPLLLEYALNSNPDSHSQSGLIIESNGDVSGILSATATEGILHLQGSNLSDDWENVASYDFTTSQATGLTTSSAADGQLPFSYSPTTAGQPTYSFYRLSMTIAQ